MPPLRTGGFRRAYRERYAALRVGVLQIDSLVAVYKRPFRELRRNRVYEREAHFPELERPLPTLNTDEIRLALERQLGMMDAFVARL